MSTQTTNQDTVEKFTETDQHFIGLVHDTITRMANNSANCKTWLLAIITAVTAYLATHPESVDLLWLLVVVDVLFYWLDSYYLQLENNFRALEKDFVSQVKNAKDNRETVELLLYDFNFMRLEDGKVDHANKKKALMSKATWPFYLVILVTLVMMYFIISKTDTSKILGTIQSFIGIDATL